MKINDLFDQRGLVAVKLKGCIREHGFTKASFTRKAGISRIMLDRLLDGNADNEREFDDCVSKTLAALNISSDDLIDFEPRGHCEQGECARGISDEHESPKAVRLAHGHPRTLRNLLLRN